MIAVKRERIRMSARRSRRSSVHRTRASGSVFRLSPGSLLLLIVALACIADAIPRESEALSASGSAAEGPPTSPVAAAIADLRKRSVGNDLARVEMDGKRLLAEVEVEAGQDSPEAIEVSDFLVEILMKIGRKPEAVVVGERALESAERIYPPGDLRLLTPLHRLGDALDYVSSFEESEAVYERALAIQEAALGKNHPSLTESLGRLAGSKAQLGDYATARVLRERNLSIVEKSL